MRILGRNYQYKIIMRHGSIMRHTIHTMFYGGSYFNTRRSEKGNFDISGILLLLAFLWCPASDLSYLSSCFREYLKKLARKIRARFDPKKFTQFNLSRFLRSLYLWRGIPRQQLKKWCRCRCQSRFPHHNFDNNIGTSWAQQSNEKASTSCPPVPKKLGGR